MTACSDTIGTSEKRHAVAAPFSEEGVSCT